MTSTMTEAQSPNDRQPMRYQHVVIMRHGDRADFIDPTWVNTASRKWDPELVAEGIARAFKTGQKIRTHLADVSIDRAFVSPFLRCLQTGAQAVSALVAKVESLDQLANYATATHGLTIDSSKIKVAIEYGLCEMLNSRAITPEKAPEDGKFSFDIPHCESLLPAGTIDHTVEPIYKEMPKWEETVEETLARYVQTTKALADKYYSENLLLVTHAAGVLSVLQELNSGAEGAQVEYCGYLYLKRPIYIGENQTFTAGQFELVGLDGVNGDYFPPIFNGASMFPPIKDCDPLPQLEQKGGVITKRFVFDQLNIKELKEIGAMESRVEKPTRVEVVTSLISKAAMSASMEFSRTFKPSVIFHPANIRSLMNPPIPETSVGNACMFYSFSTTNEGDIEFGTLIYQLRKSKEKMLRTFRHVKQGNHFSATHESFQGLTLPGGNRDFDLYAFSSLSNFGLNEIDFGWGKPVRMTVAATPFKNYIVLAADRHGTGIEAIVTLDEGLMPIFENNEELVRYTSSRLLEY